MVHGVQDYRNYNGNLLFPLPVFFLLFIVCDFITHLDFSTSNSLFISIVSKRNIFTVFPRNVFLIFVFESFICESFSCLFFLQMLSIFSVKDISLFPVATILSVCSSYYYSRIPIRELINYVWVWDFTVLLHLGLN